MSKQSIQDPHQHLARSQGTLKEPKDALHRRETVKEFNVGWAEVRAQHCRLRNPLIVGPPIVGPTYKNNHFLLVSKFFHSLRAV